MRNWRQLPWWSAFCLCLSLCHSLLFPRFSPCDSFGLHRSRRQRFGFGTTFGWKQLSGFLRRGSLLLGRFLEGTPLTSPCSALLGRSPPPPTLGPRPHSAESSPRPPRLALPTTCSPLQRTPTFLVRQCRMTFLMCQHTATFMARQRRVTFLVHEDRRAWASQCQVLRLVPARFIPPLASPEQPGLGSPGPCGEQSVHGAD